MQVLIQHVWVIKNDLNQQIICHSCGISEGDGYYF